MRGALLALAVLTAALWSSGGAGAEQVGAPLDINVDVTQYPDLRAVVSVPPGPDGKPLPSSAFTLIEGGRERRAKVRHLSGGDVAVVLVIDTSGSMAGPPLEAAKSAARSFLDALPQGTPIGLIGFGAQPVVASPFTLDRAALRAAVDGLVARGETALYDALALAAGQFGSSGNAQRVVVVLSDGGDTVSTSSGPAAGQALVDANVRLHGVQLSSPEQQIQSLVELTTQTKGELASTADPDALRVIYEGLARDLSNQYELRFRSAAHGRTELRVQVNGPAVQAEGRITLDLPAAPAPAVPTTQAPAPAPAPAEPPPTPRAAPTPSGPATTTLLAGAFLVFAGLLVLGTTLTSGRRRRTVRLARPRNADGGKTAVTELAARATGAAERMLDSRHKRAALNARLERAGVALRPGEFVVLVAAAVLLAVALGLLVASFPVALVLGGLVVLAIHVGLGAMENKRQAAFRTQLADTLQLMSGSLRAGYALMQAVDAVAREAPSPTSEEFRRLVVETRLGRDLPHALEAMAVRIDSEDFDWVVQAISIHRDVGGDLAGVLDNLAKTIRERTHLERHVQALTAEGRLSAYILLGLPIVLLGFMRLTNPSYASLLFEGAGLVLLAVGGVLMTVGTIWFKKLCRLDY